MQWWGFEVFRVCCNGAQNKEKKVSDGSDGEAGESYGEIELK